MGDEPSSFLKKIRRRGREIALQILYQQDIAKESLKVVYDFFRDNYKSPLEALDYAWKLVQGVDENRTQIELLLKRHVSGWRLERLPIIERNILRLAIYEMLYVSYVPLKVSINEAIELAKVYGSKTSSIFVNAVLDAIYHKESINDGK
jgi:N utilization substance protein B